MRPLTPDEIFVVRWFAQQVGAPRRSSLLNGLERAKAEEIRDEHLYIQFEIDGYVRPPDSAEYLLPVEAAMLDTDGASLMVELSTDENGRLEKLQVLRFEKGRVLGPDWPTLRLCAPDEVIRLNEPNDL